MRIAGLSATTLSGWGQPHDALSSIAPTALHIDYARHTSAQAALLDIAAHAKGHDVVIGWSLGGQLAVRAIASGLIKPRALVLIATPFQFVAKADSKFGQKFGMPADLYAKFRDNYVSNPSKTLHMAQASILRGDERVSAVRAHLDQQDKQAIQSKDWLNWLDILEGFDCAGLSLAEFPPTLLIHGDKDAVVFHEQSERFATAIPHARLVTLTGCGHAPHWHDDARVREEIAQELAHV